MKAKRSSDHIRYVSGNSGRKAGALAEPDPDPPVLYGLLSASDRDELERRKGKRPKRPGGRR